MLDLARSLRSGTPHRASGDLALHVLDIMSAISASAVEGSFQKVTAELGTVEPLPADWDPFERTL